MNKVNIKILFFAKSRELSKRKEGHITLPAVIAYDDLLTLICNQFQLEEIKKTIFLALNEDYLQSNTLVHLHTDDIVAVIPPISSG